MNAGSGPGVPRSPAWRASWAKRSFDRVAKWYRPLEYLLLGRRLERARLAHLEQLERAREILILGEGDGRFLERLVLRNAAAQITVIERSGAMIDLARRRAGRHASRVTFIQSDALENLRHAPDTPRFDAIVTLFFLDCLEHGPLEELVEQVSRRSGLNAVWLLSDFRVPATGWRRWVAGAWLAFLYFCFAALTDIQARRLVDPLPALIRNGWRFEKQRAFLGGLGYSAVLRAGLARSRSSA